MRAPSTSTNYQLNVKLPNSYYAYIYIFYRVTEVSRAVLWRAGGCRHACTRSGMTASTTERRCYRYQTPYMYAQPALSVFLFVIGTVAKLCLNLFY